MISRVEKAFSSQGLALSASQMANIARSVHEVSDQFVENEGSLTPWKTSAQALAYISYFMVLNYARLKDVWREVKRFGVSGQVSEIWDIGSGPGTLQWMLEDSGWQGKLHNIEKSPEAIRWHRLMIQPEDKIKSDWAQYADNPSPGALGVFSYSLLELTSTEILKKFDHLLIVEPSTQTRARKLMELRAKLMAEGYSVLAPCTHELACPLLTHSNRDWCHQRCHWEADVPSYWEGLESHLPMKNRTLTYSYLLVSRKEVTESTHLTQSKYLGRVIGDTLPERGKVRQMICRNEKREFLSWLTRHGEPEKIPHGALLTNLEGLEEKSGELRAVKHPEWIF